MRLRLLDLFCGSGGAAMGYYRAGFDVTGVDIKPMPRYPFTFIQGDALEYLAVHGGEYDVIHASPPCQAYTMMQHIRKNSHSHPDLISETRILLEIIGKPYIIENVYKSPLRAHFMLCGTMFGLKIIRHRYFECKWLPLILMFPCDHTKVYDPYHGKDRTATKFREAMGIDWMPVGGGDSSGKSAAGTLAQAIPPAYTEYIGRRLLEVLERTRER